MFGCVNPTLYSIYTAQCELQASTIERMTVDQRHQFVNWLLRVIGFNFDITAESAAEVGVFCWGLRLDGGQRFNIGSVSCKLMSLRYFFSLNY